MFLRENRHQRVSGNTVVYLQLVESVWNRDSFRAETRVVYNFGRAEAGATTAAISGLSNGTVYTFVVYATDAAGNGPESIPSNSVVPTALLLAPPPR